MTTKKVSAPKKVRSPKPVPAKLSPIDSLRKGIQMTDWALVKDGFQGLTGENMSIEEEQPSLAGKNCIEEKPKKAAGWVKSDISPIASPARVDKLPQANQELLDFIDKQAVGLLNIMTDTPKEPLDKKLLKGLKPTPRTARSFADPLVEVKCDTCDRKFDIESSRARMSFDGEACGLRCQACIKSVIRR